jgi:general secretion pathway protein G
MFRPSNPRGFTLIEMLTVMLIIAILAGLVLSINGLVHAKAASARAEGEIKSLSLSAESYKADNGSYPRTEKTDALDPRTSLNPTTQDYQDASRDLYIALSGDTNTNGKLEDTEGKNYGADFFKPSVLSATKDGSGAIVTVNYIKDPYDNCYGYSTKGAKAEEAYATSLRSNPKATRPTTTDGYNPTFDLWSTGGTTGSGSAGNAKWIKNW